jgi:hypothetical protein
MGNVRRARRGNNDALNAKADDPIGTPATLSNEAVQRVIRQNLAGVRACFLRIGRDGDQRSARRSSASRSAPAATCTTPRSTPRLPGDVASRLRARDGLPLGLPQVAKGRLAISYPFVFVGG